MKTWKTEFTTKIHEHCSTNLPGMGFSQNRIFKFHTWQYTKWVNAKILGPEPQEDDCMIQMFIFAFKLNQTKKSKLNFNQLFGLQWSESCWKNFVKKKMQIDLLLKLVFFYHNGQVYSDLLQLEFSVIIINMIMWYDKDRKSSMTLDLAIHHARYPYINKLGKQPGRKTCQATRLRIAQINNQDGYYLYW
jgi:hypothetical protein